MTAIKLGVISDTHGLLRSEAKNLLRGCDLIIHAGDIDHPGILQELEQIAPTTAVRGNMDFGPWTRSLKVVERIEVDKWSILVVHNIQDLPQPSGTDLVIFGHSHRFHEEVKDGILFLNPGSAGPRRFNLPISMALVNLDDKITVEKVLLKNET